MWKKKMAKTKRKLTKNKKKTRKNSKNTTRMGCSCVVVLCCEHFNCSMCGHTTLSFFQSKNYPAEYSQYLKPEQKKTNTQQKKNKIHNPIEVHQKNIEVQQKKPRQILQGAREELC